MRRIEAKVEQNKNSNGKESNCLIVLSRKKGKQNTKMTKVQHRTLDRVANENVPNCTSIFSCLFVSQVPLVWLVWSLDTEMVRKSLSSFAFIVPVQPCSLFCLCHLNLNEALGPLRGFYYCPATCCSLSSAFQNLLFISFISPCGIFRSILFSLFFVIFNNLFLFFYFVLFIFISFIFV